MPVTTPDLVQIREDAGRAVTEHYFGETGRGEVGALRMDVPFHEARHDVVALRIDYLGPFADGVVHIAGGRHPVTRDGHPTGVDLAAQDVD